MTRLPIARYFNPWKFRREEQLQQFEVLRQRDGDNCRRCRRPMRFDLPFGHDKAPTLVPIAAEPESSLGNLCLCHGRCNRDPGDSTSAVRERLRGRHDADLSEDIAAE